MSMAFRNVPLRSQDWPLLLLKATDPESGETFYFVDKCLPFGSAISCAIFQAISDGIAFVVRFRTKMGNVNYLDDFFFAALKKMICDWQVSRFLEVCAQICFPVSMEKTFWGTKVLVFLGLLLDTEKQVVCMPVEKVNRALDLLAFFVNKNNAKVTVHQVQKLCGLLNFLCRCVVPERAFLSRIYSLVSSKMLPHHHVRITSEIRRDVLVWKEFLLNPRVYCRPFMDFKEIQASEINMYSDASRNFKLGFGALCENEWLGEVWDESFMQEKQPSIEYLELFGVTAAVLKWIHRYKNCIIRLFCDNESVVKMLNKSSSRCKNCMVLIRLITLKGLEENVRIFAKHVRSKDNGLSDAISRRDFNRFRRLGPHMDEWPLKVPDEIWPMNKIWMN